MNSKIPEKFKLGENFKTLQPFLVRIFRLHLNSVPNIKFQGLTVLKKPYFGGLKKQGKSMDFYYITYV